MHNHSLLELAVATSFSSPKLTRQLEEYLLKPASVGTLNRKHQLLSACRKALEYDLDRDYPRRFRLNEIESAFQIVWPDNMFNSAELPQLDMAFERLFFKNGDIIHYRDDKVTEYVRCSARLDPAIIVCWQLCKRLEQRQYLEKGDVARIMAAQQPLYSPQAEVKKPVAENHAHLGGSHYDGLILMAGLFDKTQGFQHSRMKKDLQPIQRLAFALLDYGPKWESSLILTGHSQNSSTAPDVDKILRSALGKNYITEQVKNPDWISIQKNTISGAGISLKWLKQQIAIHYSKGDIQSGWQWYILFLWRLYRQTPYSKIRVSIFYLLATLMDVRRKLIMDGQGLSWFVHYYDENLRFTGEGQHRELNSLARLLQSSDDVAELKVTRHKFSPKNISNLCKALAEKELMAPPCSIRPLTQASLQNYRNLMDRWHFCVHFLRIEKFKNNPQAVWQEAQCLQEQLQQGSGWQTLMSAGEATLTTRPETKLKRTRLEPTRWIRGLDVAGDENLVKTEVFAPALRWLRQGLKKAPLSAAATPGFHLSIHSGEDYAHPLSGMRHVDEVVRFCEMRSGDRLGHALALGIDPRVWCSRHGEVVLDLDEHFDNLVWSWHYACLLSPRLPLAVQVIPILERRIRRLIPHIEWCQLNDTQHPQQQPHIEISDLVAAWHLRRNCVYQFNNYQASKIKNEQFDTAVPDFHHLMNPNKANQVASALYRKRWQILQIQPGSLKPLSSVSPINKVRIRYATDATQHAHWQHNAVDQLNLLEDSQTLEELEFIYALQDYQLDEYDQIGIIIETNPTSNIYISKLEHYSEHPIFRWYPPDESSLANGEKNNRYGLRRGPIKVCVNTDDAGIMPTTLRTEFSLLREAALCHGITRTAAEHWVETLREFGLREFHRNHQQVWIEKSSVPAPFSFR